MSSPLGPGRLGRGPGLSRHRPRRPGLVGALVMAAVAAVAAAVVTLAGGPAARSMPLDDGAAWLVSSTIGQAALVDGASAEVITQVPVGEGNLSAVQSGQDVFVANSSAGTVVRVDGSTYDTSDKVRFAQPGQQLSVFPGASAVYTVSETAGTVTVADPTTLRAGATQSLGARVRPGAALVDGAGRLWLVDGDRGDLVRLDGATRHVTPSAADPATTSLVLAGGRVTLIDLAAGTVRQVDADGTPSAATCLETRQGDDTVEVTGSPTADRVYAASGSRGVLLVSDLDRRTCDRVVDLGAAGHRLGPAREVAGLVFIADYTSGQVAVVDVAGARVVARPTVLPANTLFDLVPSGSFVFYNDPASAKAGVVRLGGNSVEILKYDPANPDEGVSGGPGTGSGGGPGDGGDGPGGQDPTTGPSSPPPTAPPTGPPPAGQPRGGSVAIELSDAEVAVGESVTARVRVSDGGRLSSVLWMFGDGSQGSGAEVRHGWARPGTYTVSARVTLADGRQAAPTARVTVTGQPSDGNTNPDGPGQDDQGQGEQGQDDKGQGQGEQGQDDEGDGQGDQGQGPTAHLKLSYLAGTAGVSTLDVTADASGSSAGSARIVSYEFDFTGGYGAAQSEPTAAHTYDAEHGDVTVRVRVKDADGRSSEASATIKDQSARLEVTVQGSGGRVTGPEELLCPDVCGATVLIGQQVTLNAAAGGGAIFGGWSGACDGTTSTTCTFVLDGDRTVRATFSESAPTTLTVSITGPGNVTAPGQALCSDVAAPCAWTFPTGSSATIHAEVDDSLYPPAHFVQWRGGAGCGTSPDCAVTMDGARQVEAVFEQEKPPKLPDLAPTVTLAGGGASASAGSGNVTVRAAPGQQFTVQATAGEPSGTDATVTRVTLQISGGASCSQDGLGQNVTPDYAPVVVNGASASTTVRVPGCQAGWTVTSAWVSVRAVARNSAGQESTTGTLIFDAG